VQEAPQLEQNLKARDENYKKVDKEFREGTLQHTRHCERTGGDWLLSRLHCCIFRSHGETLKEYNTIYSMYIERLFTHKQKWTK
jgi:hypothetical protein